jgi:hypothetical protein
MRRNAWLILPTLFLVGLAAYELRYAFEPSRGQLLADACVDIVRQHVLTPATFEVHEAGESLKSGRILVIYDRQAITGAEVRLSATCQFAIASEGLATLESVSIEGRELDRAYVNIWNRETGREVQPEEPESAAR